MEAGWYVIGVGVYAAVGLLVLGSLSRHYPRLWPWSQASLDGGTGIALIDATIVLVWVLAWPLHLAALPWTKHVLAVPQPVGEGCHGTPDPTVSVGTEGVSRTELRPVGQVEIAGRSYEARAQHGFIAAGQPVVVLGRLRKCLVVKALV